MILNQNAIDWNHIRFRKYPLHKKSANPKNKSINGLDTETLNGWCKLIADGHGNHLMVDDADELFEFLTSKRYWHNHNFFYNLNFDANAIIKYLPKENLEQLYNGVWHKHPSGKSRFISNTTFFNGFRITFIPKKLFTITKGKHICKFYDIAQFYGSSLEKSAIKYLGLDKYIEPIDRKELGTSEKYWDANLPEIIKYCINDAFLTMKLGELVHKTIIDNIKIEPNAYISKASITKDVVRQMVDVPDITKIPNSAMKYAFHSYSGGRFEILTKGNVGKCTLYDINSAYPYHIQNLLDITKGKWVRTKSIHESANYGFYMVKVFVHYNRISPVSIMFNSSSLAYPIIEFITYMTKEEILAYENYIDFEIISGWEFYANELVYPFRDYILNTYEHKNQADKNDFSYMLYKILMNSLYGAFYEKQLKHDGFVYAGKLFNPIYATMITANTRIQLFETAMPHINDVVGFATDSILFKGNPEIKTSDELGSWSMEGKENQQSIVLRSGIYQIGDKMKNRGIKKASWINTPFGKFDDIFHYIKSVPFETIYPISMNRPLTFIECLLHHQKHDLWDINQFMDCEYGIDINKDMKRLWKSEFNAGIELFEKSIDSNPLIVMEEL